MKTGIQLIAAERKRHPKLGWTAEHDDMEHNDASLALAAVAYAAPGRVFGLRESSDSFEFCDPWPWEGWEDKRPYKGNVLQRPTHRQRIRLLAKAGSFCAAEIDRLQRAHDRRQHHE